MMDYHQATRYLDALQMHKLKLGLDSMSQFLQRAGSPQENMKIVHVAGTNGKGSVCTGLTKICEEAGYTVGLYTSPHLSDVRERFYLGGSYISKDDFGETVAHIRQILGEEKITYFECTTAIALLWFARKKPDLVILETGLGGRLDATNVAQPALCVITNISLDHQQYLGDTVEQVAHEKAGIIKPGIPVIAGTLPPASAVIEAVSDQRGAPFYLAGRDFTWEQDGKSWNWRGQRAPMKKQFDQIRCSLQGEHQQDNMSLVIGACCLLNDQGYKVSENDVREGLRTLRWPGRQESISLVRPVDGVDKQLEYLLDGGHNPAGIGSLAATLSITKSNKVTLVWASMADKNGAHSLSIIAPQVEQIILTKPENERSAKPESLLISLSQEIQRKCTVEQDVGRALELAEKRSHEGDLIVVAGSLYLVGAVRQILCGGIVEQ